MRFSLAAATQVNDLRAFYEERDRLEAALNLDRCIRQAWDRTLAERGLFFTAPRPYPSAIRPGWRWLKEGPYWFAFTSIDDDATIQAVFHVAADIPGRLQR